jgi:TetR/AcrR family transcriptional regulator, repressor for neighboring sulfatase
VVQEQERERQQERDVAEEPQKRDRRSREDVSEALIDAAAALASERGSGHVTVRDIATRAGVNATFVHRYYGSKQNLMRAAMMRAQERLASRIEEVPEVVEGAAAIVHATLGERELIATLTRASLDGVFTDIPAGNPAMAVLVERFQREAARRGGEGRHDPRIVVACLSAATVGYAVLGDYIRHGTGLDERPDDEVEAMLVEVLRDVARLALGE